MRITWFAVAAALVACGGKQKPAQLAPLPEDTKAAPEPTKAPAPSPPPEEAEAPSPPPEPTGPVEVKVPARETAVKLVAKGKGKLAPLRYTGQVGGKQPIEIALDFTSAQTLGADKQEAVIPTIVLLGEAETRAIDKDGRADYAITVSGADARAVAGAQVKPEDMKTMLGSLVGMVIGGSVAANGAAGELSMRVEKQDRRTGGALEMVRLTLPVLPRLPAEPVGVGGKWQTTTKTRLAEKIEVTEVTDYEIVAIKGGAWTIKGSTIVTGADQDLEGGKISNIHGTGTSELTVAAGALYPTYKSSIETQFTASEGDASMSLQLRISGAVTAK